MNKDEALRLALEAFEAIPEEVEGWLPPKCTDAVIAIKQTLAQPDVDQRSTESKETFDQPEPAAEVVESPPINGATLKAAYLIDKTLPAGTKLYTSPPKREWQGLTDEEVMIAAYQAGFDIHEDYDNEDDPEEMHWWTPDGEACDDSLLKLRDLIEAKLKEKNT